MASRKQNKAEFTWTEHEAELLLNITKSSTLQFTDRMCCESVHTEYANILKLYQKEHPRNDEEARETLKDYRHRANQITK